MTLFDEAGAGEAQRRLVELLVEMLRGQLPVKILLSFREDYLGKVKELLSRCPELVDQALRLAPPAADALPTIIRGPFERYPGHFKRELSPALADRLVTAARRSDSAPARSASPRCRRSACGFGRARTPRRCSPRRAHKGCWRTISARRSPACRHS